MCIFAIPYLVEAAEVAYVAVATYFTAKAAAPLVNNIVNGSSTDNANNASTSQNSNAAKQAPLPYKN